MKTSFVCFETCASLTTGMGYFAWENAPSANPWQCFSLSYWGLGRRYDSSPPNQIECPQQNLYSVWEIALFADPYWCLSWLHWGLARRDDPSPHGQIECPQQSLLQELPLFPLSSWPSSLASFSCPNNF